MEEGLKQFLIILRPSRDTFLSDSTEDENRIVSEHFEYMKRATERGQAVLVGRTQDDPPLGLAIFEAENEDSAKLFMNGDPAVAAGVFTAELRPYSVALMRSH